MHAEFQTGRAQHRVWTGVRTACVVATAASTFAAGAADAPRWWIDEPVRLVQTNLPENYSTLDGARLVQQVAEFPANTLLFNLGGIVAQYPTQVEFHYASAYLPAGHDLFGEVLGAAHARGLRVVGRFDLSKTQRPVYAAHPEWFFRRGSGEPAIYNGLYATCINGGYYREHAPKILAEALERYAVDGLFFNMFGNPATDYSGNRLGPCQCDACRTKFRARHGRDLPAADDDAEYSAFMAESAREVAAMLAQLIHTRRPGAAFLTYIDEHTDVIMQESNTSVTRALPLWPYSASDNLSRGLGSQPGKAVFNLCMSFVDFPWRFATVPAAEIELRLWQAIAHGAPLAFGMVGAMEQEDRQGQLAARPIFRWHAAHEELVTGAENAARVLLLTGNQNAYRGFFRLLSEQHIPFAVSSHLAWLDDPTRARAYDLVIAPDGADPSLARFVANGGNLLVAGARPPPAELAVGRVVAIHAATQGYWRIHDRTRLPSLRDTNLLFLDGPFVELAPPRADAGRAAADSPLTLIPPAMFGPPEKVWVDKVETEIPGLLFAGHGQGRIAVIPWDVGALYYRHSSTAHGALMSDVIDALLPDNRQLRTDAHPLVEFTLLRQPRANRTLLHLVNLSGHSDTAYFPPVEMRNVTIELRGPDAVRKARAVILDRELPVTLRGTAATFTVPELKSHELIVLE